MNFIVRIINRIRFRNMIKKDESVNVVDGMVKARKLYKALAIRAHPDRHPDKREVAEELTAKLTSNKHNYVALVALKKEIENRL